MKAYLYCANLLVFTKFIQKNRKWVFFEGDLPIGSQIRELYMCIYNKSWCWPLNKKCNSKMFCVDVLLIVVFDN